MNAFGFAGVLIFYAIMVFVTAACCLEGPIRAAKARGEEFIDPPWVNWVMTLMWLLILGSVTAFIVGIVQAMAGTL